MPVSLRWAFFKTNVMDGYLVIVISAVIVRVLMRNSERTDKAMEHLD